MYFIYISFLGFKQHRLGLFIKSCNCGNWTRGLPVWDVHGLGNMSVTVSKTNVTFGKC